MNRLRTSTSGAPLLGVKFTGTTAMLAGKLLHRLIVILLTPLTAGHAWLWPRLEAGYERVPVEDFLERNVLLVFRLSESSEPNYPAESG